MLHPHSWRCWQVFLRDGCDGAATALTRPAWCLPPLVSCLVPAKISRVSLGTAAGGGSEAGCLFRRRACGRCAAAAGKQQGTSQGRPGSMSGGTQGSCAPSLPPRMPTCSPMGLVCGCAVCRASAAKIRTVPRAKLHSICDCSKREMDRVCELISVQAAKPGPARAEAAGPAQPK